MRRPAKRTRPELTPYTRDDIHPVTGYRDLNTAGDCMGANIDHASAYTPAGLIPERATLGLLALGGACLLARRRRRG